MADDKIERKGVHFKLGYPKFVRGVDYTWPEEPQEWNDLLLKRREELKPFLLDKAKKYLFDFGLEESRSYPYGYTTAHGVQVHLTTNCGCTGVSNDLMGGNFVNCHNLDSWKYRAIASNLGSDTIEFLNPRILAPRVLREGEAYKLRYPLPPEVKRLQEGEKTLNKSSVAYLLVFPPNAEKQKELEGKVEILSSPSRQEIRTPSGVIVVENGFVEGRDFQGFDVATASWVTAKLMDWYAK